MENEKKELYRAVGERIKDLRVKKGCSRDVMALKVNVSGKFLYEIETGRKGFSADVLLRIANYLETECDYIMTGKK